MFSLFLSPPYMPFAAAFVVMLGVGIIEAVGLGIGSTDHGGVDSDVDGGGLLSWLGLGELPILIWLTSFLACFVLVGIAVQQVASQISGAPLTPGIAMAAAIAGALPINTFAANGLARILPGYETTAISSDDLLRRRGTILEGQARRGHPARAKVIDQFGQAHYLMIEPHEDAGVIEKGETALLVRREGSLYFAMPDESCIRPI